LLQLVEARFEAAHPDIDLRFLDMGSQEILGAIRQGEIGVAAAYGVVLAILSTAAFLPAERGSGGVAGGGVA
jgi:hypothetical protein